jgi:hypothetical protein
MRLATNWEDLTQEERENNIIVDALEKKLVAAMMATTPNPEVAFVAAINALVYVIINCGRPHDCAKEAADAIIKGVLINACDDETQLQ